MSSGINRISGSYPGDFDPSISLGTHPDRAALNKFGECTPATSNTYYDLWEGAASGFTDYPFQTSAVTVDVSSSSTNDDLTGTGARKVTIVGLDSSYNEITESVDLDGQNRVTSSNSYLRIYRAYATEVGSSGENEGDIWVYETSETTVTAGVPQTDSKKKAVIEAGYGQTNMMIYTVPAGKVLFVQSLMATFSSTNITTYGEVEMVMRLYNENSTNNYESWRVIGTAGTSSDGSTEVSQNFPIPIALTEKTDIKFRVKNTKTGATWSGRLEGVLDTA